MMRILMVSSEMTPYAKVGGLADVVGALPKILSKQGHDVRIVIPLYGSIVVHKDWVALQDPLVVKLPNHQYCQVWEAKLPNGVTVYLLEHHIHFGSHEIYLTARDKARANGERFTFLSRASIDLCYKLNWVPDIIHCHDWPTGLVPVYLSSTEKETPLCTTATVFTIHNLEHQGIFDADLLSFTGLPDTVFTPDYLESMGSLNMMKGALTFSTELTTVSPHYASEIQTETFGCGLDAFLRSRTQDITGILNGIDTEEWNPATDKNLPSNFSHANLYGKTICKNALQKKFYLEENPHTPIFAVVSRLYHQKGLDMLLGIIDKLLQTMSLQLVILGSGEEYLEHGFTHLAHQYRGKVGVYIGYNNALAHLIKAGSDFFIMPSRFEPCGLSQLYAMAYGSVPIVRSTGGLVDTVEQYQQGHFTGTGFRFEDCTEDALYNTIGWACSTFYDRHDAFTQLQYNGMRQNFSWDTSINLYEAVYKKAKDKHLQMLKKTLHLATST